MMKTISKRYLLICLLLPFQAIKAELVKTQPIEARDEQSDFVYLSKSFKEAVRCLEDALPNYKWSENFRDICARIANDGIAAPCDKTEAVVDECLRVVAGLNCEELKPLHDCLRDYKVALKNGDAHLVLINEDGTITRACCDTDCDSRNKCRKYKDSKAFCQLFAKELEVVNSAFISELTVNTLRVIGTSLLSGDVTFGGDITVEGDIILIGDETITGDLTVEGTFTANGNVNMGTDATVATILIGTGAAAYPVTIGSLTGAAVTTINAGTGSVNVNSTNDIILNPTDDFIVGAGGDILLDSVGVLQLNSSAGTIDIGNDAIAQAINIGTGASDRDITIGNTTATTTIALNTPAGTEVVIPQGISITAATQGVLLPGPISIVSGTGDPNGVVTAPQGSLYLRTDGSGVANRAWINTTGAAIWTAISTVA